MMKKGFLILLCVLCTMTLVFVGCGKDETNTENPTQAHTHTYASTWSSDETGHWYAATCEHTDVKANNAAHVDENNDGVCDVCEYASCEHRYADTWSTDEANHWYASECGHAVTKDKGAHADENKDGVCDTCAYVMCEHTFEEAWSTDETNHWHAATCGCDVKKDDAAHTGMEDGICDVCAYGDHEHTWSEYKSDEKGHWKESTCTSHGVIRSEEGAHTNEETNDGICDVCAYVTCTHTYKDTWSYNKDGHFHAASCGCDVPGIDAAAHNQDGDGSSCTVCNYVPHEDTYSDEWKSNSKNHWREATCGCASITDFGSHEGMEDGICDVCAYGMHNHTWTEEYKSDETNHWLESTCQGHSVIQGSVSAHIDANNDGVCDICKFVSCTHEFDETKWEFDARGHWYAPTCGHDVKGSYEAHDEKGENSVCSVCGYSAEVIKAIDKAVAAADKVSSGTVVSKEKHGNYNVTYEFGKNYTHVIDACDEYSYEYWNHLLENGNIFSLRDYIYNGHSYGVSKFAEATPSNMLGREFSLSFLDYSLSSTYGVEEFIRQIYEYAMTSEATNGDLIESVDEATRTYSFSFECITGNAQNGTYKIVNVSFTLSENDVITSASMEYVLYRDPTGDPNNTQDKDYILFEDGTVKLLEGASADEFSNYTITQTEGERAAVSPYNPDEILISDFNVTKEDGSEISSVELGAYTTFIVSGVTPSTVNFDYDALSFSATVDGVQQWFSPYFDQTTCSFAFTPYSAGEWEIIIKTVNCEKIITFTVARPAATSLTPTVDGSQKTSTTVYVGTDLIFSATAQNSYADKNFIPTCDSANVTFTEVETADATWRFSATEVGTYVITLTSTVDPSITATLTVEVKGAPSVSDTLNGKYEGSYQDMMSGDDYTVSIEFVPEASGALKGTVNFNVKVMGWTSTKNYKAVYSYEYADGVITTAYVSGDTLPAEYPLAVNSSFGISFTYNDMFGNPQTAVMDKIGGSGEDENELSGEWRDNSGNYSITFWGAGETSTLTDLNTYKSTSFYYSFDSMGYIIFDIQYNGGIAGFDSEAFAIMSGDELIVTLSNGEYLTFTLYE